MKEKARILKEFDWDGLNVWALVVTTGEDKGKYEELYDYIAIAKYDIE